MNLLYNIDTYAKEDTRCKHWFVIDPSCANHLIIHVEAATVNINSYTNPNVAYQGVHCVIVGYSINHNGDCNRMWNPKTNYIYENRDVIWLQRK